MKRTLLIQCLSFLVGCLIGIAIISAIFKYSPTNKQEQIYIIEEVVADSVIVVNPSESIAQKMQHELGEIDLIEDKEAWFIAYKDILFKYVKWFDMPETIFDTYTEDEITLIFQAVETECHDADFDSKCNVASVILNRINSSEFGDTIEEVITNPNQFAYDKKGITESTILSVMYVYEIGDTTDGCIAFRSDQCPKTWYGWKYVFTDDAGHNFYK